LLRNAAPSAVPIPTDNPWPRVLGFITEWTWRLERDTLSLGSADDSLSELIVCSVRRRSGSISEEIRSPSSMSSPKILASDWGAITPSDAGRTYRHCHRCLAVIPSQRQVRMLEQTLDKTSMDKPRLGASAEEPAFDTGSSLNAQPMHCCLSSLRSSASNGPVRVPDIAMPLVGTITSECATAGCRPTCDSPFRPDHGPCITCRRRSRLHRSPTASLLPTLTS
jgi:hypothetical protein